MGNLLLKMHFRGAKNNTLTFYEISTEFFFINLEQRFNYIDINYDCLRLMHASTIYAFQISTYDDKGKHFPRKSLVMM